MPENKASLSIELIEVSKLRALEGHGPKRVDWLAAKVFEEQLWTVPIKVERTQFIIMDGHHRFEVAKRLNLRVVPAELFSYDEVELYSLRKTIEVTAEIIFENARKDVLFPYKTAKHIFPKTSDVFTGVPLYELK